LFDQKIGLWLICGIIWPHESMPPFGSQLIHLAPLTYPIDALRCIISKGWGLTHPTIIMAFGSSFVYISLFLIIALFIYQKNLSVY
jgi:ABC-type polysaccharide/polyol phosphate export permease